MSDTIFKINRRRKELADLEGELNARREAIAFAAVKGDRAALDELAEIDTKETEIAKERRILDAAWGPAKAEADAVQQRATEIAAGKKAQEFLQHNRTIFEASASIDRILGDLVGEVRRRKAAFLEQQKLGFAEGEIQRSVSIHNDRDILRAMHAAGLHEFLPLVQSADGGLRLEVADRTTFSPPPAVTNAIKKAQAHEADEGGNAAA